MKSLFPFLRALFAIAIGVLLIKTPEDTLKGMTIAIGALFLVAGVVSFIAWLVGCSLAKRQERKAAAAETGYVEVETVDDTQQAEEVVTAEDEAVVVEEHDITVSPKPVVAAAAQPTEMPGGSRDAAPKVRKPMFPIAGIGSILLGLLLMLMPLSFVSFLMYVLGAVLVLGALYQFFVLIRAARLLHISWLFYLFPAIILFTGIYVLVKPMESATLPLLIIGWCMIVYGVVECVNSIKIAVGMRKLPKDR